MRRHAQAWTDAARASRWLAAVVHVEGRFFWTRTRVPEEIWAQFLPREDEQIGGQELMAVPLLLATFKHLLHSALEGEALLRTTTVLLHVYGWMWQHAASRSMSSRLTMRATWQMGPRETSFVF